MRTPEVMEDMLVFVDYIFTIDMLDRVEKIINEPVLFKYKDRLLKKNENGLLSSTMGICQSCGETKELKFQTTMCHACYSMINGVKQYDVVK
jgi:hypothetical protein